MSGIPPTCYHFTPAAVYGPGDYQHRMFAYIKRMDDSRPAILLDEKRGRLALDTCICGNVADALWLQYWIIVASGRTYNLEKFVF